VEKFVVRSVRVSRTERTTNSKHEENKFL